MGVVQPGGLRERLGLLLLGLEGVVERVGQGVGAGIFGVWGWVGLGDFKEGD